MSSFIILYFNTYYRLFKKILIFESMVLKYRYIMLKNRKNLNLNKFITMEKN